MKQSSLNRRAGGVVLFLALVLAVPAGARDEPSEPARPEDQAAVRARTQDFLKALAAGDAKEVAAFWTASGEYVHGDDLTIRGRAAIEKAYTEYLKKKGLGTVEMEQGDVR